MKKFIFVLLLLTSITLLMYWWTKHIDTAPLIKKNNEQQSSEPMEGFDPNLDKKEEVKPDIVIRERTFFDDLSDAAIDRTMHRVSYDPKYVNIPYPMGDVPQDTGVCTDVIIRSYRKFGIDLQQLVHEDIKKNFRQYPAKKVWGSKKPDSNIDHRRVYNLQAFFERHGESLVISDDPKDYRPGDLVTWQISSKFPHIGIVVDVGTDDPDRFMVSHNIGEGPKIDDILFEFPISGHYRYNPNHASSKE